MYHKIVFSIAIAVVAYLGVSFESSDEKPNQDQDKDVAALKMKRLSILEERVLLVEKHIEQGIAAEGMITQPRLDWLNAKLEYAETNDDRREILQDKIDIYDTLIEMAELATKSPPKPTELGRTANQWSLDAQLELMSLRAEQVRLRVKLEELDSEDGE